MVKQLDMVFPEDPPPSSWALMRGNHPLMERGSMWHCALYHFDEHWKPRWTQVMQFTLAEARDFFGCTVLLELEKAGPNDFLYFEPGDAKPLSIGNYPGEMKMPRL